MKAQKLPSGMYRAMAYLGKDEDGKAIRKSFTAPTEKQAEADATAYESKYSRRVGRSSVSSVLDAFLRDREPVLSPTTIKDYANRIRTLKRQYPTLCAKAVVSVTSKDLQDLINSMRQPHQYHSLTKEVKPASEKTIRNYVQLLSAAFHFYGVDMPEVKLPQRERAVIYVPTVEEIKRLLDAARGTDMYVVVALAAFGPLRRGEICALKYPEDFEGTTVHVHASIAGDRNKGWVEKAPKSYASDRHIELNEWIVDAVEEQGYVTQLNPQEITARFSHLLKKAVLPHFRFHDLRHFAVSYLHSIGVPDAYIIQRTGHEGEEILKRVYRHTLEDQKKEYAKRALDGFNNFS